MKKAFLITPQSKNIPILDGYDYIGVDSGALLIIDKGLPIKFAIGDFDSMSDQDLQSVSNLCEIIKHPIQKNETDSELAILTCVEKGYQEIVLYGAISQRLDHTFANILLLLYRFCNLVLMDDMQKVQLLRAGTYQINNDYKHISFFAIKDSILPLEGFLYPLYKHSVTTKDIFCVSNTILDEFGKVVIDEGEVLCIQSNFR